MHAPAAQLHRVLTRRLTPQARGDVLRVAPETPRALRALPRGPANPSGEPLVRQLHSVTPAGSPLTRCARTQHVLITGASTLGGPFPKNARARHLIDDAVRWLPALAEALCTFR